MGIDVIANNNVYLRKTTIPIIVSVLLIGLYGSVIPTDYTSANYGADGGDFLSAILTGGIPHPTGYPTYMLLGKVFQILPFGTPYFKGALLSLFFSAVAAGLLSLLVGVFLRITKTTPISIFLAGFILGTTPLYWSQAVIVEVYGLQSFFTVCCIFWITIMVHYQATEKTDLGLSILSILVGGGIGNHLTILLIFPAIIFAASLAFKKGISRFLILKYCCLMGVAGVLVYVVLPVRASMYPPINWGNPQDIKGFIWLVTGQLYQKLAFGVPAITFLQRLVAWANQLFRQFGFPGMFLGIYGAVQLFSSRDPMKWVFGWIFFGYSIFSIGYLTNDSLVYLMPSLMIFSIWICMAVEEFWASNTWMYPKKIFVILFVFIWVVGLPSVRKEVDPRLNQDARDFAKNCLASLPDNAVIFTSSDENTFPLWYFHFGLNQRPDIKVVARGLTGYDWYLKTLKHTYPDIHFPDVDVNNWETQFIIINPDTIICNTQAGRSLSSKNSCICSSDTL